MIFEAKDVLKKVNKLSFIEWYEETQKDKWHEDYAGLYRFADKMLNEYEKYCKEKGIEPIYDG